MKLFRAFASKIAKRGRRYWQHQLLEKLNAQRYGAPGSFNQVERLVWSLAAALEKPTAAEGLRGAQSLTEEGYATWLERLREIVSLAERAGVLVGRVRMLEREMANLPKLLDRIKMATSDAEVHTARESVSMWMRHVNLVLAEMRAEVEEEFHVDLITVLPDALRAQAGALAASRIDVTVQGVGVEPASWRPDTGPRVVCDADDLRIVLDEVVGSAIVAMEGAALRVLSIDWLQGDHDIELRVRSTGSVGTENKFASENARHGLRLFMGATWVAPDPSDGEPAVVVRLRTVADHG